MFWFFSNSSMVRLKGKPRHFSPVSRQNRNKMEPILEIKNETSSLVALPLVTSEVQTTKEPKKKTFKVKVELHRTSQDLTGPSYDSGFNTNSSYQSVREVDKRLRDFDDLANQILCFDEVDDMGLSAADDQHSQQIILRQPRLSKSDFKATSNGDRNQTLTKSKRRNDLRGSEVKSDSCPRPSSVPHLKNKVRLFCLQKIYISLAAIFFNTIFFEFFFGIFFEIFLEIIFGISFKLFSIFFLTLDIILGSDDSFKVKWRQWILQR
jgi:hypothetical protein